MRRRLAVILLAFILLTSCTPGGSATPESELPTSSPVPTDTPTPTSSPLTILVVPADLPRAESDQYQKLVYDLAKANGMRFQVRNVLTPADLAFEGPALKIVVTLPPDPGLVSLVASAPAVQFLALGIPGLDAAANLSSVGAAGLPLDQQAFVAGYIAGLLAPEWRVGILSRKDSPGGDAAVTAFSNGYAFYCGDCFNPNFPQPFSHGLYPIIVRIPVEAPERDYNGYADLMFRNFVKVTYLYPEIANPNLASYMAQNGMLLISQTMPGEDLRPSWIASIQPDLTSALQNLFPQLVAGNGGQVVPTPLSLAEVNPELLSDAKMRLVQDVLAGLQNGTIGSGVNP